MKTTKHALILFTASLAAGCGTTTPVVLDREMGTAVAMSRAQQTLHPQASQDMRPVEGIDGKSADALIDRYHRGFQAPTAVNIFNIGVGGGAGTTLGPAAGMQ